MKYSPLAIHCTSLCFDMIQDSNFKHCRHADIDAFRDDIYALVRERTSSWSYAFLITTEPQLA